LARRDAPELLRRRGSGRKIALAREAKQGLQGGLALLNQKAGSRERAPDDKLGVTRLLAALRRRVSNCVRRHPEYDGAPPACSRRFAMALNTDKIDDTALALLYLTLHDGYRAWKGMDWDVLGRLHDKGLIDNPVGKVKSVVFTEEGLQRAKALFAEMFEIPG
jgi:Domain of unknown function (DUF6429)